MSNAGSRTTETVSQAVFKKIYLKMRTDGASLAEITRALGMSVSSRAAVMRRAKVLGLPPTGNGFTHDLPPDDIIPVEEILARKQKIFERKAAHEAAAKLIDVEVHEDGPVGILHFGDPHIDDDGCDIVALKRHIELANTVRGLFAANVGDSTNNWIGRLAHLYGEQTTTAAESTRLLEWFIRSLDWLYLIGGNHDAWSGARDPIDWIQRQRDAIYTPSECRLQLNFPNGRSIRINARHDFNGHSMWNPAHGVGRATQMGVWDDIAVGGHRHVSGYMPLVAPDGRICHALQVASYKVYDHFAKTKGFRNQHIEPAVLTIVDPDAKTPAELVTVFLSVERGVDYLKYIRKGK